MKDHSGHSHELPREYVSMGHVNAPAHPPKETDKATQALQKIAALDELIRDLSDSSAIASNLRQAVLNDAISIAKEALSISSSREVIEPLTEPVSIEKALLGGREAKVEKSPGGAVAVFLVNIQVTGWNTTQEHAAHAEGYALGFNTAARWMQEALVAKYRTNATRYEDCRAFAVHRGLTHTVEEYDKMVDDSNNRHRAG